MNSNANTPEPLIGPVSLPVVQIIKQGLLLPLLHAKTLLRVALPLILVYGALVVSTQLDLSAVAPGGIFLGLGFLLVIAVIAMVVMALIGCHRVFILGDEALTGYGFLWWTARETRFLGWLLAVGFCVSFAALPLFLFLVFLIPSFVPQPEGAIGAVYASVQTLVGVVYLSYFTGRWSLVFPATAVDERPSLGSAWDLSAPAHWQIMLLVGLMPFVLEFITGLLPEFDSIFYTVFISALWLYVMAAEIALLSLSYKALCEIYPQLAKHGASAATTGKPLESYEQYSPLLFQGTSEHAHSVISTLDGKETQFNLTFTKTDGGYEIVIAPDDSFYTDKRSFSDIRAAIKYLHENSPFRVTDFA